MVKVTSISPLQFVSQRRILPFPYSKDKAWLKKTIQDRKWEMCQQHNVEEWRSNAPLHSEIGYQSLNVPAIWQIFTMTSTALFITWMETNS